MRYQSVDLLRGIAVIFMAVFHFYFMSTSFFHWESFQGYQTVFFWVGRSAALLFLLISGLAFGLSYEKKSFSLKQYYRRAWQIFLAAFLITLGSYFFSPERTVWFGILHFFALSFILLPWVVRLPSLLISALVFGCLMTGVYLTGKTFFVSVLFLPLGFRWASFQSFDYYPLLPWFGYVLIGYLIAVFLKSHNLVEKLLGGRYPRLGWLARVGERSLWIYLLHIPLIYGLLWLLDFF
ncbi:MAG TPA: heparan-alpha-glucosaminide N-acetyltransferase [Candidatus Absconditabacterales bacterium]|nr:heparan-alpha-glucosaminide N-acetyltransferase [Candidatus Absconditabacterales bacterium]